MPFQRAITPSWAGYRWADIAPLASQLGTDAAKAVTSLPPLLYNYIPQQRHKKQPKRTKYRKKAPCLSVPFRQRQISEPSPKQNEHRDSSDDNKHGHRSIRVGPRVNNGSYSDEGSGPTKRCTKYL